MTRPVSLPRSPADLLSATHRDQLALCDLLETIADSLPRAIDRPSCIGAARALGPLIQQAHELEENIVFPAIASRWRNLIDIEGTMERLRYEHMEDECFSEELHDALMAYGRGEDRPNPEAFGYMLRGFFESLRRHIAFEREVIMPLFEMTEADNVIRILPRAVPDRE